MPYEAAQTECQNQKVQKIVDAASVGIDDAVSAIKESGLPNKPLISASLS